MVEEPRLNLIAAVFKLIQEGHEEMLQLDLLTVREREILAQLTGALKGSRSTEYCKHCNGTWPKHIADPYTAHCQCDTCQNSHHPCVTFELRRA